MINTIGKIGKRNAKANNKLAELWNEEDIQYCEVCEVLWDLGILIKPCLQASTNAHRNKRYWYKSRPELLYSKNQVVRACINAHDLIENNKELSEKVFLILRGPEII